MDQKKEAKALKPITKIKIGVDLLSLLQYMGVGGKIASWIKEELEEKFNFTIYIIFEVFLEAKAELSLTYNTIEGFAPGPRKLQIEAGVGIKGGVKSTEFVSVFVPEADGKLQEVKVEKFKGEASGISSILYTYEVKAEGYVVTSIKPKLSLGHDNKGTFAEAKCDWMGINIVCTITVVINGKTIQDKGTFNICKRQDDFVKGKGYILQA
jgi:hypothetical protein